MNYNITTRKNKLLNYDEIKKLSLDDLQKKIINKQFIINVNNLLNDVSKIFNNHNKINNYNTKIFLSSYSIIFHKNIILHTEDIYSDKLSNCALDMILFFEKLFDNSKINLKDYYNFFNSFNKYIEFFKVWKERDSLILIRPYIKSYWTHDTYKNINLDKLKNNKYKDNEEKKILEENVRDLEKVKNKLKQNIKLIAGNKGINFLEKNEIPYFKDEKIFTDIDKTVRKAFWDVVKENLKNKKYDQVILLLGDIKTLFIEITQTKKSTMDEFLDLDLLSKIINKDSLTYDIIDTYINFIIKHIETLQPPVDDEHTNIWKENIKKMFQNKDTIEDILVYFFKIAFEKLEKIKTLTLKFKTLLNNNK